mgnify:CR=1 FL=1
MNKKNEIKEVNKVDKEKIRLNEDEWSKRIKKDGETSYEMLVKLFNSPKYKKLPDTTEKEWQDSKEKAIERIYRYSNIAGKYDVSNKEDREKLKYDRDRAKYNAARYFNIK